MNSIRNDAHTAESLIRDLERLRGMPCAGCRAPLCHHQVLFSIALGFKDAPRCLPCLGAALDSKPAQLRDSLFDYIRRQECYWEAWNWANRGAGVAEGMMPPALQSLALETGDSPLTMNLPVGRAYSRAGPEPERLASTLAPTNAQVSNPQPGRTALKADAGWDAGDTGCGELVLELRLRLEALPPGKLFHLAARDPGAPEDLPAWCRLTGHRLVRAEHPNYWIQRKG